MRASAELPPSAVVIDGGPAAPPAAPDFASLLLGRGEPGDGVIDGTWRTEGLRVTRGQLAALAAAWAPRLAARGLHPGDTVALLRLPRRSETVVAASWVALATLGYRVLLPMSAEHPALGDWLDRAGVRAALRVGAAEDEGREDDARLAARVEAALAARGLPGLDPVDDLGFFDALAGPVPAALPTVDPGREVSLLTTSGTGGLPRVVRHDQRGWLASVGAWAAAGLYAPDRLGGPGLCLLLAHSMGVRALVNALWTGQPTVLVPPEWFLEHPARAREALIRARPTHLTGGPAAFRLLLELGRAYPSLTEDALRGLCCVVNVGAPLDPDAARAVEAALRLPLHAGLGTTETLLVTTTLVGAPEPGDRAPAALGRPLPGVRLGLVPTETPDTFRLHVAAPFAARGELGEDYGPWIDTGDLVGRAGGLRSVGRADGDGFKDGFGVKVSRRQLAERYAGVSRAVVHLEAFPLREEPGLAALVFLRPGADALTRREVVGAFEARNEALAAALDTQELRHATLARLQLVDAHPPRTAKGEPSRPAIAETYRETARALCGPWQLAPGRVRLERLTLGGPALARFGGSARALLLNLARLDRPFERATGDRLTDRVRGEPREVLDLVGGFGANLLGHRHPEVMAAARAALADEGPPLFDQATAQRPLAAFTEALARMLAAATGRAWVIRPVNTGSEAVELALAHAWLAWRRRLERIAGDERARWGEREPEAVARTEAAVREAIEGSPPRAITLERSFHGHSLGARALGAREKTRAPFAPLVRLELTPVRDGSEVAAAAARVHAIPVLREGPEGPVPGVVHVPAHFVAFAEPVRGEGGFDAVDPALLRALAGLDLPLVLDEVQCGLGRTGSFPASPVVGDAFLFAKALGGGVAKVGAVAWVRDGALADFDEHYASTFAGDAASSAVATAVLGIVAREDVPGRARRVGERLCAGLLAVRHRHPGAVAEVRGAGCMIGVRLRPPADSLLVRAALGRELFGVLVAGWFLDAEGIRVLPALDAQDVLRVEPSAFLADADADRVVAAFGRLAALLERGDMAALFGWLVPGDRAPGDPHPPPPRIRAVLDPPPPGVPRVGFVHPFVHPEAELLAVEPSLAPLGEAGRRALFDRLAQLADGHPVAAWSRTLLGGRAWVRAELVPMEPATLEDARRSGETRGVVSRVQEAVGRAAAAGCTVVVLGAGTSSVTRDGEAIRAPAGVRVVSGNSLTTAIGAARAWSAARSAGLGGARVGILGATGNIGAALVAALVRPDRFRSATLVGRDPAKLARLAEAPGLAGLDVRLTTDVRALADCRVLLTATATPEPLVFPEHLPEGTVLVADLAMPSPVARVTWRRPGVVRLHRADVVPVDPDVVVATHTPPGTIPCCLAEGLLAALHPAALADHRLVGRLDPAIFPRLAALARAEGLWPEDGA